MKRVTGKELTGMAANGIIHLINSGATTLDGTGQQTNANGEPAMKPCWEITEGEVEKCLEATTWYPANLRLFPWGWFLFQFLIKRRYACNYDAVEPDKRSWSSAADSRRLDSRD